VLPGIKQNSTVHLYSRTFGGPSGSAAPGWPIIVSPAVTNGPRFVPSGLLGRGVSSGPVTQSIPIHQKLRRGKMRQVN
jgi:hypothetical protein